jgi:2-hydroxychromene-2-carboxylate isomerase
MQPEPAYSKINYFFSLASPWAYMGHEWFLATARNRRLPVIYKPVKLMELFAATGGVPLAKRHKARQDYRFIELQRWQMRRGIEMNLKPKFFPFNPSLADRTIIAAFESGINPGRLTLRLMRAVYCREQDLSREEIVVQAASSGVDNIDGEALVAKARTPEIEAIYQTNTDEAVAKGVFGSPTYETGDELYWGQDRIELMNEAIEQDRTAYKVPD